MAEAITVHFHPGWPHRDSTVLAAIAADGVYRTQWETGTSNGGLTARPGGDRWRWESRLFGQRYDEASPGERPIYGAWNRRDDEYGAAPRFGSAYLKLKPDVLARATFCWPDSVFEPEAVADASLLEELCARADAGRLDPSMLPVGADGLRLDDPLNDYVEAHVHGGLVLDRDVEALVLDPSDAEAYSDVLAVVGCAVEVHAGYRASAEAIDRNYRSEVPVELARTLGGEITPSRLASAARSGKHDPQAIKWLWHCLARFGRAW